MAHPDLPLKLKLNHKDDESFAVKQQKFLSKILLSHMKISQVSIHSVAPQDRCRATVLRHLTREEQIDELELPRCLKRFISEGLEDFPTDVELTQNNLSC